MLLTLNIIIREGLAFLAAFLAAIATFLVITLFKTPYFLASALTWALISFCSTFLIFSWASKASFIALAIALSSFAFTLSNFSYSITASFSSSLVIARLTSSLLKNWAFLYISPNKLSFFPRRLFFFSYNRASLNPFARYTTIVALAALLLLAFISFLNASRVGAL